MNFMDLSVIILSYNTQELTKRCLDLLVKSLEPSSLRSEIIVVDNASSDDSVKMLQEYRRMHVSSSINLSVIENKNNVGFTKGNNQAIKVALGKYILLLNSDAMIESVDFQKLLEYLDENPRIGALTVKLNLVSGSIDPASHRGFPTPWSAFCYFSKLEKLLGKLPLVGSIFGGYHMYYKDLNAVHEVDAITGAFFLTRNEILKEVNGFDEEFFMYGEDIDLAYRIKEKEYKIIYYPFFTALHLKNVSGIKGKDPDVRVRTHKAFYDAMKIFYKKHYEKKYPSFLTAFIYFFIDFKKNRL